MIFNATRQRFLSTRAGVADTFLTRLIGLLGKRAAWIYTSEGLWIVPSSGVHTFGMRFPIDVVFVDRRYTVVAQQQSLVTWRISRICLTAASVVELPPGTLARTGSQAGDQLEFSPLREDKREPGSGTHQLAAGARRRSSVIAAK